MISPDIGEENYERVQRSVSFGDEAEKQEDKPLSPTPPASDDDDYNDKQKSSHSEKASSSRSIDTLSQKFNSKNLRSNLTREQRDRDPLFFYEVVKTIGAGSMGSVARVTKRGNVVGGSARKDIQEAVKRQKRNKECLKLPIIGGLFRLCIDEDLTHRKRIKFAFHSSGRFSNLFQTNHDVFHSSFESSGSLHDSFYGSISSDGSQSSNRQISHAMKSIHLNRVTDAAFVSELRNEIAILKQLDHPHIVRAIETFEHRNQIFIIMELCSGGDLYSRDPYTEEEAARILSSVLSALAYMHSKNVAHRDLKYENILFVNDSPKAEVKVIDFGLSKTYGDNSQLTEGVGKQSSIFFFAVFFYLEIFCFL
jgi:serine/threonine protein kinase